MISFTTTSNFARKIKWETGRRHNKQKSLLSACQCGCAIMLQDRLKSYFDATLLQSVPSSGRAKRRPRHWAVIKPIFESKTQHKPNQQLQRVTQRHRPRVSFFLSAFLLQAKLCVSCKIHGMSSTDRATSKMVARERPSKVRTGQQKIRRR